MKKSDINEIQKICGEDYLDKKLIVLMGKIDENEKIYMDFTNISGLFIAGTTGTGKSIFIDNLIINLMKKNTADEIKFIFLDPKKIELGEYDGIKYILTKKSESNPIKGYQLLLNVLYLIKERTISLIDRSCENINEYNSCSKEKWPHIFIFIDEGSDMYKTKDSKLILEKILKFGKVIGIHLIFATNDYLKDYSTNGFIKKFKYRMTFDLASKEQAKYIGLRGSSWLNEAGEAIIKGTNGKPYRFQARNATNDEIEKTILSAKV